MGNEVCDLLENVKNFDPTKEPEKPKPVEAEAMEVEEKAENDENAPEEGANAEEMSEADRKAIEAAMVGEEEVEAWDDDVDDLLARLKAEKKAKGLDTLNMKELDGLSKEEKIKLLEEKRAKFRAQKKKNEMNEKLEKAKKDREVIKAQADMQRKREAHQNKMAIEFKKKQKADNKRRKAAA